MTPAARISAAIEILDQIEDRGRPAVDLLKEWGNSHRFAGSKDRNAIASLVYDCLRRKSSARWLMDSETSRAIMLGMLRLVRHLPIEALGALFDGSQHGQPPISEIEASRFTGSRLDDAPDFIKGDYPEWLSGAFVESFGAQAATEGAALSERAPVDLRVNLLKGDRDKAIRQLAHLTPTFTPWSPWGLRLPLGADGRSPVLAAEPAYAKGLVEVQDEGSQIASLLSSVKPGQQVLDLCAGGGGKSLAFAAMMDNRGQIYAADTDGRRLMPLYERLERAGARNIQVRAPKGQQDVLGDLVQRCDVVFVDAPCTGTGAWRRNPDAKWRVRPGALEQRLRQQDEVLNAAVRFLKPGGALIYVTCSVLKAENEDRVSAFLERHPSFLPRDAGHVARQAGLPQLAGYASTLGAGLRLSPAATGTDGFYIAALVQS